MKIAFIGHPGSGKTYAATTLAKRIGIKEIDIDNLLDNLVYFFFKKPHRKAFDKLLKDRTEWILDGYAGKRMPTYIWNEADYIVYLNFPKSELKQNIYNRYRFQKNDVAVHSQEKFMNLLKNLWQIYVFDRSLTRCVNNIRHSSNSNKLIEVGSRQKLDDLLTRLGSE